jgi:hypothetical protein
MIHSLHVFGAQCVGFGSNFTSSFDDDPDPETSNNTLPGDNDRIRMEDGIIDGRKEITVTLDLGLSSSATTTAAPRGCGCCGTVVCSCCVWTWTAAMSMVPVHSLKVHMLLSKK